MHKSSPTQTPIDKAATRIEIGQNIAYELDQCSRNSPAGYRHELNCLAMRIRLCNSTQNTWICPSAKVSETSEPFVAIGRYWRCGSKLCPDCLADSARKMRAKLREIISKTKLRTGERWYFVTLTIPRTDASLVEAREIVNRAWSLFRKRQMCVALIRGGVKTEEFTVRPNGFHYHIHGLWLSKWLLFNEVRRIWTECVEIAFNEAKRPFLVNTKDGLLIIKLKMCKPTESVIHEVCKYITKSDSWSKLRLKDLRDIAMIRRWHRMFEIFGCFRAASEASETDAERIVHTRSLSDGDREPSASYWRDKIVYTNYEDYESDLLQEIATTIEVRSLQLERRYGENSTYSYRDLLRWEASAAELC